MSIEIKTIHTAAFSMRYVQFGRGKTPLVILPGLSVQSVMGAADAIAEAYAPLTDDFTLYVLDRRESLPEDYSLADMARDTAAAMQALGLSDVCLFGASQGGMIALLIAIEHPELVSRLALGSTAARVTAAAGKVVDRWIRLAEQKDGAALYLDFGKTIYPPDVFEAYRAALVAAGKTVTDDECARFITLAQGTRGFDVRERLSCIRCPVLLLGAEDDAVLGADATNAIADALGDRPNVQTHLYRGYGHAAFDTAPDYKNRLLRFFKEN